MKKVVAFIFDLSKGGAQGVFVNVVNYLYHSGIDIEVVVQNLNDPVYQKDLDADIPVTNLNVNSAKALLPQLLKYVSKKPLDLAMAFSPEIALNLLFARKMKNRNFPVIGRCINTLSYEYSHVSGLFRKYITHSLLKMFYHRVDCVIAQSTGMGKDLIDNYKFQSSQIKIINNAMGLKFENELAHSSVSVRKNYLLYAGRLEEQKGLKMLLEAFANIKNKSVGLKIIGSGSQKAELKNLAKDLKIADRVEFIPYTTKIEDYYREAVLTVLSSYFEGFPNVLVESIACGTPVVSYDLPSGPKEIIINGENGLLVKYLDVEDFTKKIDAALEMNWNYDNVKNSAKRYCQNGILPRYLEVVEGYINV